MDNKKILEKLIEHDNNFKKIDERFAVIENTMLTKDDSKQFLTKDDAKQFLTKDDAKQFLTKDDSKQFATKNDLKRFATKVDLRRLESKVIANHLEIKSELKQFATKDDLADFRDVILNALDYQTVLMQNHTQEIVALTYGSRRHQDELDRHEKDIKHIKATLKMAD